jgi:hypothetical protein
MTSLRLFKDLCFGHFIGNFNIVELEPFVLLMVFDKCEIMTTFGATIVNTDGVEMERTWVELEVILLDFFFERCNLLLELSNLYFNLISILWKDFDAGGLFRSLHCGLLLKW